MDDEPKQGHQLNPNGIDPDMIRQLEDTLERAKRGEIRALGLVAVTVDMEVGNWYSFGLLQDAWAQLVAGVASLHHRLMNDCS